MRSKPDGGGILLFDRRFVAAWLALAQIAAGLILSGCALRPRQDLSAYRVVRHERSYFIYPPGQRAGSRPPEQAVVNVAEFGAATLAAGCSAGDSLVALERGDPHRGAVARVRLDWELSGDAVPTADENRAGQLRRAFEELANGGCFQQHTGPQVASRVVEGLPLPFAEVLPYRYGFFRGGSVIDLRPGTRLKVQQAFFRPEAGASLSLRDYIGTVTSYYDVAEAGDEIVLNLGTVESDVPPDSGAAQDRAPALGGSARRAPYFRLVFLGLIVEGDTERKSVLISADSYHELETISGQALANPESPCAANPHRSSSSCFEFGGAISTEVELQVTVNGVPQFVGMGTALRALIPTAGTHINRRIRSKLELVRAYSGRKARVLIDWSNPNALELPLLAGDEVSWR